MNLKISRADRKRKIAKWTSDEIGEEIAYIKKHLKIVHGSMTEADRTKQVNSLMQRWAAIMEFLQEQLDVSTTYRNRQSRQKLRDEGKRRQIQRSSES